MSAAIACGVTPTGRPALIYVSCGSQCCPDKETETFLCWVDTASGGVSLIEAILLVIALA